MPHEQATKAGPKIIEFRMAIVEKEVVIDDAGTKFQAMTFNGSMPGPMMVVHEGDYVELTLVNPETNTMPHNIDFHSATGALGGGALTLSIPASRSCCAGRRRAPACSSITARRKAMIPWHVVSGMHGTVMVLPRDGLKDGNGKALRYDRVYLHRRARPLCAEGREGQVQDLRNARRILRRHHRGDAQADPDPRGVQRQGRRADRQERDDSKVGETVMIVHSQANRDTRPHLIGGHGDYVWETGKFANPPEKDLETWFIRGGSAGAALYTFRSPASTPT